MSMTLVRMFVVLTLSLSVGGCAMFGGAAKTPEQKRACSKVCIDEFEACKRDKCTSGSTVDRGCVNACEQTRNDCLRPCQ